MTTRILIISIVISSSMRVKAFFRWIFILFVGRFSTKLIIGEIAGFVKRFDEFFWLYFCNN
jgi:hypothetical protein